MVQEGLMVAAAQWPFGVWLKLTRLRLPGNNHCGSSTTWLTKLPNTLKRTVGGASKLSGSSLCRAARQAAR